MPSQQWDPQEQENIWRLSSTKRIKIIPISMRLLFQKTFPSGKRRGVGIRDAYHLEMSFEIATA